jgi:Flp pilus assembly protein TadG
MRPRPRAWRWVRGHSLVMTAALMPVIVGVMGLSVDTAVLATARAQLKTVADAAALAGAQQLADNGRLQGSTNLTPEINNAMTAAQNTGQANAVLGQAAVLLGNPSNSASGDIVVGYTNVAVGPPVWTPPPLANALLTNSVRVNATRDANHVGVVPAYFSRLFGFQGSAVSVQSTATVQNYTIKGFQSVNNQNVNLLPIVLDQATYNNMITAGQTGNNPPVATDQYTYNPTTKTVAAGPDGVYESVLYPVSAGDPGNWGTVKIGVSNNSTSTLAAQIQYGITPAQMATFPNGVIQLDPTLTPPSITFNGNPGISAGIKSALESIIGNPVSVPIYDETGGNGNNSWYRVVQFAAVRIMAVSFQGNPKYVIVQPAFVQDPSAIAGSAQTSWTNGGVIRLMLTE